MSKNESRWTFNPGKERLLIAASSAIALIANGLAMSLLFPPAAFIAATVYSMGAALAENTPASQRRQLEKKLKKAGWEPLPENEHAARLVNEASLKFGRELPPKIYAMKSNDENYFAADPDMDVLATTKAALGKIKSEPELAFIAAHEVAHLQMDKASPVLVGKKFMKKMEVAFAVGFVAAWGLPLIGISLPFALGMAATSSSAVVASIAATIVSFAAIQFGTRVLEGRADRNALYVTGDLAGAESALANIDASSKGLSSRVPEMFRSHPSLAKRVGALRQSFDDITRYRQPHPPAHHRNHVICPKNG